MASAPPMTLGQMARRLFYKCRTPTLRKKERI
jgi:hypothetical protein